MSGPRDKGTRAETAVVEFLRGHGFPFSERRALSGSKDRGDVLGVPGLTIEVKSSARYEPGAWLLEADRERRNGDELYAVVVHKPRGVGLQRPEDFHVISYLSTFCELIRED